MRSGRIPPMAAPSPGVLLIACDGDVLAFRDAGTAARYVEAIDVKDGEYDDDVFYTVGGSILRPSVRPDDEVELIDTGAKDLQGLKRRLRELQPRNGYVSDPDDPRAVVNELLGFEWDHRWPKHPRWLDRWIHGEGPDQL